MELGALPNLVHLFDYLRISVQLVIHFSKAELISLTTHMCINTQSGALPLEIANAPKLQIMLVVRMVWFQSFVELRFDCILGTMVRVGFEN